MRTGNTYKPGTIQYRLMEEDWSRENIEQIAEELQTSKKSIQSSLYHIKKKTGYHVPYLHLPPIPNKNCRKKVACPFPCKSKKKAVIGKCDTCARTACREKYQVICWTGCGGYQERTQARDKQSTV